MTESIPLKHSASGFTLLEVLIALSILAILMVGLLKIAANNTRNLVFLENTLLAEQVAHNCLLKLRMADYKPERDQSREEMAGRRWLCEIERGVEHPLGKDLWRYRVKVFLDGESAPYVELISHLPVA